MNTQTDSSCPKIVPDYYLIKLDERPYWNGDLILKNTKANYGVYAFDRNEQTHCCELTPSYCLVFIANEYEEIDGLDEDLRDEINCAVLSVPCEESVTYMHVSSVERMMVAHPERVRQVTIDSEDDDDPFDQIMEGWHTGADMF